MSLEDFFVSLLNRRQGGPRKPQRPGIMLGCAETLIGAYESDVCVPPTPPVHTFVSGRTGSGKTTLLTKAMSECVRRRIPFFFTDFHGHATQELLAVIAQEAQAPPVILLEPWSDPVMGWNPLASSRIDSAYAVVQGLISIFHHRLWSDSWGPRLEELLRMALLALIHVEGTLLEVSPFLSRPEFRRAVIARVAAPEVREFWTLRFERLSPAQRSAVTEPVLNKMSVFNDPSIKYVIGQPQGKLNFEKALSEGHIIILNLSVGQLRGNQYLLGALSCEAFKSAVYRRPATTQPYLAFLDEFQEMVALDSLDDYLRSFRKFGCSVFLATQHLQLSPEMRASIFANCGRFVCFGSSAADASIYSREFGSPEGDLAAEMLPDLPTGQAIVKERGEPLRLLHVTPNRTRTTRALVAQGRAVALTFGRSRSELDQEFSRRMSCLSSLNAKPTQDQPPEPGDESHAQDIPEGYE